MCIYCGTAKYRKIYEQHYGPIPLDEEGRSFEIHHKDGNHSNNHFENLEALHIKDHYDKHFENGDWFACFRISKKMNLDPKEVSLLIKNSNKERIKNGTHNLLGNNNPSHKRIKDGTYHMLGGKIQKELALKRSANGSHNLQNSVTCRDKNGCVVQIPQEIYHKQKETTNNVSEWEYVFIASKEAKRRKNIYSVD